jgi:hypothetical protein
VFNLTERIGMQKDKWCEHILRMITHSLPKILFYYKPRGHKYWSALRWEAIFSLSQEQKERKKYRSVSFSFYFL